MRTIRRQAKATSLDHAIELAKQHAKEQHRPSKVMADLMGVELKTYYPWLLDNTLPLNRIAQFEALTGSRFISEYLSVLHGDRVVIEIPRGRKGKAADMAQVQSQTAAALALLAKWHGRRHLGSGSRPSMPTSGSASAPSSKYAAKFSSRKRLTTAWHAPARCRNANWRGRRQPTVKTSAA